MNLYTSNGLCLPTSRQQLLLTAALFRGKKGLDAWQEWRKPGLDDIDWGSFRLLPLLYRNLQAQQVDDPFMPKLRGIYRRFWYENQVRFRDAQKVLRLFQEADIKMMLLKGSALSLLYYRDSGARPMQDVDIAVPEHRVLQALDLLRTHNFTCQNWVPEEIDQHFLRVRHAIGLEDSAGCKLDVHWHLSFLACFPGADEMFWEGSIPFNFQGISTRTLNATDHFVHTCLHGAAGSETGGAVRWIADAATILRSSPDPVDWDRVIRQASRLRVALPLREQMRYLKEAFELPIPASLLSALEEQPVSYAERLYFERLQLEGQDIQRPLDALFTLYCRYNRSYKGDSALTRLRALPSFLRCYWTLPSTGHVLPEAGRRFLNRLPFRENKDA